MPSPPTWIDAHSHLADPRWSADALDAVIARSRAAGVHAWLQGGIDPADWARQLTLRARHGDGVLPCFGLHPWWAAAAERTDDEIEQGLRDLRARAGLALAIGEAGLDRAPKLAAVETPASWARQQRAFEGQIELARELGKPLVLHVVKAHDDAVATLESRAPLPRGGLVHLFTGSAEVAARYIRAGFLISVGGAITRPGYETLKRAVQKIPPDHLVIETDSPDQTPDLPGLSRQDLNEPAHLVAIAERLSGLVGRSPDELLAQSTVNLKRLLGLEKVG